MSGQLTSYISPIINPLQNIQRQLTQQVAAYRDAQHKLLNQEQSLVSIGNSLDAFVGQGASAFEAVCDQYVIQSERNARTIDQALQVIGGCIEEIWQATASAEIAFLDEVVVSEILARITLDSLLRDGADAVMEVLNEIVHFCASTGNFFGRSLEHLLSGAVHTVVNITQDFVHMTNEVWNLLGEIPRVLSQWASAISSAVSYCLNAIKDFGVNLWHTPNIHQPDYTKQQAESDFVNAPNAENAYKIINKLEGTSNPVEIIYLGNNTIIVLIAGLDLAHSENINNIYNAFDMGGGNSNDPYVLYTKKLIEEYIHKHGLKNPNVILAGHSAGGMVAQYVADQQGKTDFHVTTVITYGSPQVSSKATNINYDMYYNQNDPVPLLSWYESGKFVKLFQWSGMPAIGASLASGVLLYGVNATAGSNPLKQWIVDETKVPDIGNSPRPGDLIPIDHSYLGSNYLTREKIPGLVKFDASQQAKIPVQNLSAPKQNQLLDFTKMIGTLQKDFSSVW